MNAGENNSPEWLRWLKAELRRDRKKTTILAALALVAVVVVGRLVLRGQVPRHASADVDPVVSAGGAGRVEPARDQAGVRPRRGGGDAWTCSRARREYLSGLDRDVRRDIFRLSPEFLPPGQDSTGDATAVQADGQSEPGWFGRIGEWISRKRAQRREEMESIGVVRAQARSLRLQSTMLGPVPSALINGQVLRKGDRINGFLLKSIRSGSCTLTKDGVDVVLRLERGGGW